MICLTTFSSLPILAKTLWMIPKYNTITRTHNFNKTISFEKNNYYIIGKFQQKHIEHTLSDRDNIVYSNVVMKHKYDKIEENCKYIEYSLTNTCYVKYSLNHSVLRDRDGSGGTYDNPLLQNKIELQFYLTPGNKIISSCFHSNLPFATQKFILEMKERLDENKDNFIVR